LLEHDELARDATFPALPVDVERFARGAGAGAGVVSLVDLSSGWAASVAFSAFGSVPGDALGEAVAQASGSIGNHDVNRGDNG
jgi:hypothetical protein